MSFFALREVYSRGWIGVFVLVFLVCSFLIAGVNTALAVKVRPSANTMYVQPVPVVPVTSQNTSYKINAYYLEKPLITYPVIGCSTSQYDAAVDTSKTIVIYSADPVGFKPTIYLKNQGSKSIYNVTWELRNKTTGQLLYTGSVGVIHGCQTGLVLGDTTITRDFYGAALKVYQGNNDIETVITGYDQISYESQEQLKNNRYTVTISVPTVDLTLSNPQNDYTVGDPQSNSGMFRHTVNVYNAGTAAAGAFNVRFELNGQTDATVNYPSLAALTRATQTGLGTRTPRDGYNFVRVVLDGSSQVIEVDESRGLQERNNVFNFEVLNSGNAVTKRAYDASATPWFMFTPSFGSDNSGVYLMVPVMNVSSASLIVTPTVSVYLDTNANDSVCSGSLLKSTAFATFTTAANATKDLKVAGFSSSQLSSMNGKPVCVDYKYTSSASVSRTITAGFPDVVVSNYQVVLVSSSSLSRSYYTGVNLKYMENTGMSHTVTLQNIGGANVSNITVHVYTNGALDGSGVITATLTPGSTQNISITPTQTLFNGFNIVKIVADKDNSIAELNESNNKDFYEVKIDNGLVASGYPKKFVESQSFYMYQPQFIDNSQTNQRSYKFPVVNIADSTIYDPKIQMKGYYTTGTQPAISNFGSQGSWTVGQFKDFQNGPFPKSCFTKFEYLVSRMVGDGIYMPYYLDNVFNATDLGSSCM